VEIRENCVVSRTFGDRDRVRGVHYTDPDGLERIVQARFVVDASGHTSKIHSATGGTRRYSEFFQNLALFGYFEKGKRLPAPNSGNILSVAFAGGWFWYIPLSDQLTSVGAVVKRELAGRVQGDAEQALLGLIGDCPLIAEYLSEAQRVTSGPYGMLRVRKDYSYRNTAFWRPGMALIGDAACFVDPVFSSGVHLATYSGLLAARSLNSVLAGQIDEARVFAEFEARYRREYNFFYQFLLTFYEMNVDEQSYFWRAKKVTNCPESELAAFVELVGGVASGDVTLTGAAQRVAEQFRAASRDLNAAVESISRDPYASMGPMLGVPAVSGAMQEGAQIQAHAILGADAGAEEPLFPGGLISSTDGVHWQISK
jgi:halogenation protein CepH